MESQRPGMFSLGTFKPSQTRDPGVAATTQRPLIQHRIQTILLLVLLIFVLTELDHAPVLLVPFFALLGMPSHSGISNTTPALLHNFSRHAILLSGMAIKAGIECWDGLMEAFVDGEGRRQDVYVVLALGGEGTGPPTEEETAVIDFYSSKQNVVAVMVDTTPVASFEGTRMASIMQGAPYPGRAMHNGQTIYAGRTNSLMFWKSFLAWELMVNATMASKHKYDVIVKMRPDVYLPKYAWEGRYANLDEFSSEGVESGLRGGRVEASQGGLNSQNSLESLGCVDSLYYRSWSMSDDIVPGLSEYQIEMTGGHATPLLFEPLPPETEIRGTIFFPFISTCCGGINDYFAWGKADAMREYFGTALRMDALLGPGSKLVMNGELPRKYGMLAGLREEEERHGRPRGSFLLELRPCDKAVYCLVKWYPNGLVDPNSCPHGANWGWKNNVQSA